MTLAQIEERVSALEKAVEELQTDRKHSGEAPRQRDEDFLPGAEYPVVLDVPPYQELSFRARIVSIEPGIAELGLSEAEWDSLALEDDHE